MDTGIDEMILWLKAENTPPKLPSHSPFRAGISTTVTAPPAGEAVQPVLQYSFVTGDTSQPMIPQSVEWRIGRNGINTGRTVLARASYLYDADVGCIGFRVLT
jgi:hypothetical protein